MQNYPWEQTIVGWIHITSASLVVGGLFLWLLARRAVNSPQDAGWERAAIGRFRAFFWSAALLLLLTGIYTWTVRLRQGYPGFYFHVVYTKVLLYAVLFGLAGPLTKPRDPSAPPRKNAQTLLTVCVVLSVMILFLSAFMRRVTPQMGREQTRTSVIAPATGTQARPPLF